VVTVDLAVRLEQQNVFSREGKTLFIGSGSRMPDGDGPFGVLIESFGLPPLLTHDRPNGVAYERPRVQLVVKGRNGQAIREKALAARDALFVSDTEVNGTWYTSIRPLQEPFDLPPDTDGRSRVAFNVECQKRP
jgi:hypothetical protein